MKSTEEHSKVPESTENGRPLQVVSEAIELLMMAALREEIPSERARAFAISVLRSTAEGRLIADVLEGGDETGRALVMLAGIVTRKR